MLKTDWFTISWIIYTLGILYAWAYLNNHFFSVRKYKTYGEIALVYWCTFGVFAFISADYYSYETLIYRVQILETPLDVEPPYWSLIPWLNYNNTLLRCVLLIPSFLGLWYIFKRYTSDFGISIGLFTIILLNGFSTTIRSSFADVIFFLGAFYFLEKKSKISFLLFLFTTIICCVFHKSGFMLIIPFLFTILSGSKSTIKIMLWLFPVGVVIVRILVGVIFSHYFEDSSYQEHTGYQSGSVLVRDLMYYFLLFLLIAYSLWINRKSLTGTKSFNSYLYKFVFFSTYIWLLLLVSGSSRYLASRFLAHTLIAVIMLISLATLKGNKKFLTTVSIITGMLILVNEFGILTIFRERIGQ